MCSSCRRHKTATGELTGARAVRLTARRERKLARLRRQAQGGAVAAALWLAFAAWYFAEGHPVAWGYVGLHVMFEVLNYLVYARARRKLAE